MQKGIKPFAVLLVLLSVFVFLAVISAVFPREGLRIGPNLHLHFPGIREIISPRQPEYADITHITGQPETGPVDISRTGSLEADSVGPVNIAAGVDGEESTTTGLPATVPDPGIASVTGEDILRDLVFPIQHPEGNDASLYNFFESLGTLEIKNSRIRVIHYGDSQIENDRITSVLRNRLQSRFGGGGIGMFPVVSPVPHSASINISHEGNWKRFTPLQRGSEISDHNRYGLLLSYSAFDTAGLDDSGKNGSVTFRASNTGFSRSRRMDALSVHLGFSDKPFVLELVSTEGIIGSRIVPEADSLMSITWALPGNTDRYSLVISGQGNPEIYAVSIDDTIGVAVDNVPLRGSAGLEFSHTDPAILKKMMEDLDVSLILLQFGVNVVPNVTDDYSYYENSLLRQLQFLKSLSPQTCIIIIGVSDMSARTPGGFYESWPNIELIRDAQRNAAFRAGFPFWDLYEAMGGKNSMPAWVAAEPSLGQADHTHFTYRGASLIGELLFNALMAEYEIHKSGKENDLTQ